MDPSIVRPWLRSVVGPYALGDRVFLQVDAVLQAQRGLRVATDVYTSDDGRSALLIRLSGTLPVNFRGSQYNIPLVVWVPHAFPREPPLVYVEPTRGMAVRPGHPFVQLDGRVVSLGSVDGAGQYLARWARKWEASNLVDLLTDLQECFGADPPVYAVPAGEPAATTARPQQPPVQAQAPAPSPTQASAPVAAPKQAPSQAQGPPPAPPPIQSPAQVPAQRGPPPVPVTAPAPAPASTSSQVQPPAGQVPPVTAQPPVPPPKPAAVASPLTAHLTGGSTGSSFSHTAVAGTPAHLNSSIRQSTLPGYAPPEYQPPAPYAYAAAKSSGMSTSSPGPASRWIQPPMHANSLPPASMHAQSPLQTPPGGFIPHSVARGTGGLPPPPAVPRPPPQAFPPPLHPPLPPHLAGVSVPPAPATTRDIMDEVDQPTASKPAPVRPPNPELLRLHHQLHSRIVQRIQSITSSLDDEARSLSALNDDLDRGHLAITDEARRLEAVRDVCRSHAERMMAHNEFAGRTLNLVHAKIAERLEGPDAGDDWIMATSIPGQQLINLVAESNAIEDTMYQLSRAFSAESLPLDQFLKHIRMLAREQFLRRALAMRIANEVQWT